MHNMRPKYSAVALFFLASGLHLLAQQRNGQLAPTPPLGWNSWDSYGLTITEPQFKANVNWMNRHLKRYGWQYAVIDEGWYLKNPENRGKPAWHYTISDNGLYLPADDRFPSAAKDAGFKALADFVHAQGLKFGIHIIRGIPREAVDKNLPIAGSPYHAVEAANRSDTCTWNPDNYGVKANDAGQAYYDSMAKLYASWGVDFIKVDCISSPYMDEEIHMMSRALQRSGRPIVLSLSPGPTPIEKADDVRKDAQMWRISGDLWDKWSHVTGEKGPQDLLAQFNLLSIWAKYSVPGHWPDADMLPIGYLGPNPGWNGERKSRFTDDEAQTLITLWSISRSPLMIGSNLPRMDSFTESLLTNSEVLAVDQRSEGNHPVLTMATTVVWLAHPQSERGYYLGIFNVGDSPQTFKASWEDLGIANGSYQIRDLWTHSNLGVADSFRVTLKPHASALYRLTSTQ
jgi:hypothetical protein